MTIKTGNPSFCPRLAPARRAGLVLYGMLWALSLALGSTPASADDMSRPTASVGLFVRGRHPVQAIVPVSADGSIHVRFGEVERTSGVAADAGLPDRKPSPPTITTGGVEAVVVSKGGASVVRAEAWLRETLVLDESRPATSPENDTYEVFSWSFGQAVQMDGTVPSRRYERRLNDGLLVIEIQPSDARLRSP